jgi:uncharacterized protein
VPQRLVFLDTSFILALENCDDPVHEKAKSFARTLAAESSLLLLHWGIILEIGDGYARVDRREKGWKLVEKFDRGSNFRVVPLTDSLIADALALYRDRPDKNWGLTDCVSFVLMQREGISEALTADIHFRQAGFNPLLLD